MVIKQSFNLLKPVVLVGFVFLFNDGMSQTKKDRLTFHEDQLVFITTKVDEELPARIISIEKNKKKYWVNRINDSRRELVHRKYLRAMKKSEVHKFIRGGREAKTRDR